MRLFIEVGSWQPDNTEFSSLLSLLPLDEQNQVLRYTQREDRKRAICSRFMVRHVISKVCQVSFSNMEVSRTKGGKPFNSSPRRSNPPQSPNFNFNVSHDGNLVVIASESHCIVGVDCCCPLRKKEEVTIHWLRSSFANQLSPSEWAAVEASGEHGGRIEMESSFQRLWALKEAYVKARGDGLGFGPLSRVEFTLSRLPDDMGGGLEAYEAKATVDGASLQRWRFNVETLGTEEDSLSSSGCCWVAVALGPPDCLVDEMGAFRGTLKCPQISDDEMEVSETFFLTGTGTEAESLLRMLNQLVQTHLRQIRPRWKQIRIHDIIIHDAEKHQN